MLEQDYNFSSSNHLNISCYFVTNLINDFHIVFVLLQPKINI